MCVNAHRSKVTTKQKSRKAEMKVFVIHYSKLKERKRFLLEQFETHGITSQTTSS